MPHGAIWRDDVERVRALVTKHPHLLHEMARGTKECNWGPPMSYAANLGRELLQLEVDVLDRWRLGETRHRLALRFELANRFVPELSAAGMNLDLVYSHRDVGGDCAASEG